MGLFDTMETRARQPRVRTVSQLTREITVLLEENFPAVAVTGELSNVRQPASGHVYLTLKDDKAQISGVIWRSVALRLPFALKDGLAVTVYGELSVYPGRGTYQIIIRHLEPRGIGTLELAFRQLCDKLKKEGLFAEERKRPIPPFPRHVGIVTSTTGAALRDMLRVIDARFPNLHVLVFPAAVQGEGAAQEIARAIEAANRHGMSEVLIVGRGGGSLEDLWAFNEEIVARAIVASGIPVISAVGHEIDVTVSDLVADARAATPTAAAEMVTREWALVHERLDRAARRLALSLRVRLAGARDDLRRIAQSYAFRRPLELVRRREQRLDELGQRLALAQRGFMRAATQRLETISGRLAALSPLRVLARGYSITTRVGETRALREAAVLRPGDRLRTRLHNGETVSIVEMETHG